MPTADGWFAHTMQEKMVLPDRTLTIEVFNMHVQCIAMPWSPSAESVGGVCLARIRVPRHSHNQHTATVGAGWLQRCKRHA